jgi:hypothetical protein
MSLVGLLQDCTDVGMGEERVVWPRFSKRHIFEALYFVDELPPVRVFYTSLYVRIRRLCPLY